MLEALVFANLAPTLRKEVLLRAVARAELFRKAELRGEEILKPTLEILCPVVNFLAKLSSSRHSPMSLFLTNAEVLNVGGIRNRQLSSPVRAPRGKQLPNLCWCPCRIVFPPVCVEILHFRSLT